MSDGPRGLGPRDLVTLAIPTFNRREALRRCLGSAERCARGVSVLVLDDGSCDGTREMIAEEFPSARRLGFEENRGPAFARNRALEAAATPYVAFVDSDVEFAPGWLEAVLPSLAPDAVLACRVDRPDGSIEWGPRRTRFWGGSTPCRDEEADVASGNNMVVPVALALAVGGFSEELGFYFEDTYFCICARRAGYRVRYLDGARVIHHHDSRSSGDRIHRFFRNRAYAMVKDSRHPRAMAALQIGFGFGAVVLRAGPGPGWSGLRGALRGVRDAGARGRKG